MATFNTAFGSLPTPEKELFGNSATARKPKARGTGQIEQGVAPGSTMNFADMQKNGIARPAPAAVQTQQPPMLTSLDEQLRQPVAAPAPPPQVSTAPAVPPMLSTLQATLPQPTTTAPVPAATPAPVADAPTAGSEPIPVGAPAAATAPAAAPAPRTNTVTYNDDGSMTVTNPETPVANPPTFKAGTVPPPSAPNGSTFTAANGLVWTKRSGLWSYEGGDTDPRIRGYGGLAPIELIGQTNDAARGQQVQSTQVSAFEFIQNNGIPDTEAEWATLAANTGKSVAQLKTLVASNRFSLGNTQKQMRTYKELTDPYGEAQEWMNDPANANIRWEYTYVPREDRKEGDPPFRLKTEAELRAEGRWFSSSRAFDKSGGGTAGGGGGDVNEGPFDVTGGGDVNEGPFDSTRTTGGGGGGGTYGVGGAGGAGGAGMGYTPPQAGGASSFYAQPTTTYAMPNYSNLLGSLGTSLGTSAAPSAAAYAGSTQALDLRKQLEAQLGLLAAGSDTQRRAFDATRGARSAELTAQYGAERSKLEEDLAARGLSASTIGGGRYGDLAGQQARAMASFEAEMLKQQSEAEARDRALYMSTMSDLAGMAGTQDLGTYEANLKTKQINSDIAFRAAELQQEAALKGRELDITTARDRATSQYQSGQLGLGYAEMRSREQMQREDQTFRAGESQLERDIRLRLQGNEIRSQEEIAKLDRGLRDKIASGELTLSQGIALGNVAGRIWDGSLDLSYWDTAVISLGLNPKDFPRPPVNPNNKNSNTPPPNPDTSGNPPRQENPPPAATLQNYTPGTRFNIRGVIYTLDASGRLFDPAGRQYNYSDE